MDNFREFRHLMEVKNSFIGVCCYFLRAHWIHGIIIFDLIDSQKQQIQAFLEQTWVTLSLGILTLWALYAEDFKIAFFDSTVDTAFGAIAFICLVFFSIELGLSCYAIENYAFRYEFLNSI